MRVAGYVRVSTEKQAEQGLSLEEQERRVRAYVESQGWELAAMYVESGVSGRLATRPELSKLLGSLDRYDGIVIPKLDRLGRSGRHLYETFGLFEEAGVRLVSIQESIDSGTPVGRMLRGILAALAEFESDLISERVQSVTEAKARSGRFHGGPAPYGYVVPEEGAGLVIHEEQAGVVRRIFAEFNQGKAMRAIARGLKEEGILRQRGGIWSQSRIREILDQPYYAGFVHLHGETYEGEHEAIIDAETWERARALRLAMKDQYGGRGRRPRRHLFKKGLLRCGLCGHSMYTRTQPDAHDTYRCSGRDERLSDCTMPPIPRADLDLAVFDYFRRTALDPEESLREYQGERTRLLNEARVRMMASEKALRQIEDRRGRIKAFLQDGQLAPTEWREQDEALATAIANAQHELDSARAQAAAVEAAEEPSIFVEWQTIRDAVAGEFEDNVTIEAVRAALARVFHHFLVGPVQNPDPALDSGAPRFDISGQTWVLWPEMREGAERVPLSVNGEGRAGPQ